MPAGTGLICFQGAVFRLVGIVANLIEVIKQVWSLTFGLLSVLRGPGPPVSRRVPVAAAAHSRDRRAVKRSEENGEQETEAGHEDAYASHILSFRGHIQTQKADAVNGIL